MSRRPNMRKWLNIKENITLDKVIQDFCDTDQDQDQGRILKEKVLNLKFVAIMILYWHAQSQPTQSLTFAVTWLVCLHKNVLLNYLEIWISGRGNTDGSWQQAICEETAI